MSVRRHPGELPIRRVPNFMRRMVVIIIQDDDFILDGVDLSSAVSIGSAFPNLLDVVETVASTNEGVTIDDKLSSTSGRRSEKYCKYR